MTQQIRPQGGGPGYAPNRDLAHCFPNLLGLAVRSLEVSKGDDLVGKYLTDSKVSPEDLGQAVVGLVAYIDRCLITEIKTSHDALVDSGFMSASPEAQLGTLAKLGEITMFLFYHFTRDARALGEKQLGMEELKTVVMESTRLVVPAQVSIDVPNVES